MGEGERGGRMRAAKGPTIGTAQEVRELTILRNDSNLPAGRMERWRAAKEVGDRGKERWRALDDTGALPSRYIHITQPDPNPSL